MKHRNPTVFDSIEAYLNEDMTPKERLDFERLLSENRGLQIELEKHRLIKEVALDTESLAFREKIIALEEAHEPPFVASSPKNVWFNWKIAAAFIGFIGVGFLLWFQSGSSQNALFDNYFTLYPVEDVVRGEKATNTKKAFQYYANKDFEKAIPALKKLLAEIPSKLETRLYLGNAYLAKDSINLAIKQFNRLLTIPSYKEQAQWYLALSYLQGGEIEKVKSQLKEIIAYDGIYKSDADSLLAEL